jgi:molybdate transport system ATP-binding protein
VISVAARHALGDFSLDVTFESDARVIALFGPSGSGKSTLLNVIAGLIRPQAGMVRVEARVLTDTETGTFVPPHRRRIGYVFQDTRLFPHLSVRRNLAYGRWFTPGTERYAHPDEIVALLGLRSLLDRRPPTLSGGEKQRVAIGRALLASPRLLLMDEPLAYPGRLREPQPRRGRPPRGRGRAPGGGAAGVRLRGTALARSKRCLANGEWGVEWVVGRRAPLSSPAGAEGKGIQSAPP